jgi:hypothetical protein
LACLAHETNTDSLYPIDSFPLPVCGNIRIRRCRRDRGEAWRGDQASKRYYFYGLKILMVTAQGQPVEFFLSPGALSDTKALKLYAFDIPDGAKITGDQAYNDDQYEDLLAETHRSLVPLRRQNSKRPHHPALTYRISTARHAVETIGSLIERLLPKHIHSVTAAGFELKTAFFILDCRINFIF